MLNRLSAPSQRAPTACAALLVAAGPAWAQQPAATAAPEPEEQTTEDCLDALAGGKVQIKMRYRFENVDQDGISKEAYASTLRTALQYTTLPFHGFQIVLEFEDVRAIGSVNYNDTINGEPRPVVADPEGTEVNQSYLDYKFSEQTLTRLGRQRILLDNQRFVGNVGWRQNEQTFDALSLEQDLGESGQLFVAYVDNVNRIFGEGSVMGDARMSSGLLNANWNFAPGKLTGYWYELDYDDAVGLSTSTLGLRFAGGHDMNPDIGLVYALEGATQEDTADNPVSIDANYYLAELGAAFGGVTAKLGYESLSGSSTPGDVFSTPLATLHAFNGWADKFLTTPPSGLDDTYISVKGKLAGTTCHAVYHDFQAETGGADYGTEIDLAISRPINKNVTWGLKYANYMEDGLFTDTEKIWAWISLNI